MMKGMHEQLVVLADNLPAETIGLATQRLQAAEGHITLPGAVPEGLGAAQNGLTKSVDSLWSARKHIEASRGHISAYLQYMGFGALARSATGLPAGIEASTEESGAASLPSPEALAAMLFTEEPPSAAQMADLVARGLTEGDILAAATAAGHPIPEMTLSLQDVDVLLPFLDALAAKQAQDHPDAFFVDAARGGDMLHYYRAVRYPHLRAVLLPASTYLWRRSPEMRDPALAADFLAQHGIDAAFVHDASQKMVLSDEGFNGRIGVYLDEKLKELYGVSLRESGRMGIELISTVKGTHGKEILPIQDQDIPELPKTSAWMEYDFAHYQRAYSSGHRLAIAINLLPRSCDSYESLVRGDDGIVRAMPRRPYGPADYTARDLEHFKHNVDSNASNFPDHNGSVVNPVAAAVVQRRIVKAALDNRTAANAQ